MSLKILLVPSKNILAANSFSPPLNCGSTVTSISSNLIFIIYAFLCDATKLETIFITWMRKTQLIIPQSLTQTACSPLAARTSHNHLYTNKLHSTHISPKSILRTICHRKRIYNILNSNHTIQLHGYCAESATKRIEYRLRAVSILHTIDLFIPSYKINF